jgi:arabinan endo-1,5-alpha-L-arabinosidase
LAWQQAIEAPCLTQHDGYYFLFVNWGECCRGTNSTYNIRVGRSLEIGGPYLDRKGHDLLQGGGTLFLETDGRFIGPGHAGLFSAGGTNWLSYHFYDGDNKGISKLSLRPIRWSKDNWPEAR